jgi:pimeloyl-ACP methyl ester carboxylesterase
MRLHHRGLLAVCASALLLAVPALAGCASFADTARSDAATAAASGTPAAPSAAPIDWTDCDQPLKHAIAGQPGSDRKLTFQCGRTEVPITYDEPRGRTLPLFLIRVTSAGQTNKIGSLVVNPGGPGASGADAAVGLALRLPAEVLERFDIVGFDPRGVGLSTPIECIPADEKDEIIASEPRPVGDQQLDEAFDLAQRVADGCEKQYGDALGTFNTVDTARDMDRLREALGEKQLTYLGYSYGTTLGSTYAELFPDKVRALVLDAVVDPDADPVRDAEASAAGLEAGFDRFAKNCTGLIAGCPVGKDPRHFLEEVMAAARTTPIRSSEPGEKRRATPGVIMTAVQAALYDTASWPQLAQSLAAAKKGDAKGLFSLADSYSGRLKDGTYTNLLDANVAINCADTTEKVDESEVRRLVGEWNKKYPLFGAGTATGLYTCSVWHAKRTPLPERDAAGSKPILVVGNDGDPVTPLKGAQDMAKDLDHGVLLTWQGDGHTAYPKTDCVTRTVDAYLIDLKVPLDGLTCPA